MKYEKELEMDFGIVLSEEHIRKKGKRYISMKRQKQHKQRLLYELSHCTGYKPSIWRECKWDRDLKKYVYTNRIKRGKRSGAQKCLKKASCRKVRHLHTETLLPKGNHYRRVFDYWWTWI